MSLKYAYGYIRVSTHDQEEISPDSQEHLLRDYAAKNNIVILKIFTDLGISGRKADKRPGFQEMIGLAKGPDHPVDCILVWKFSRFARNQEESIVYKSLLKKQHNVDVISISEPLADGPFGSLIERIIEWMDEYYSIRLSGEVFRGMKENATNRIKDQDEWIIADGMQEAIISKELFDAAQERLKKIYKPVGKRPSSTYKHWLSGLLKCPVCGRTLTATTMKRANGEKYAYFSCYGYSKGKCDKPHGVSSLVIEKEVLKALEEALGSNSIVYEMREIRPQELSNERTLISERLASLKGKEDRIRASYREGIDTLEEYKENKALIAKERDSLERQLAELEENTPDKILDDPTPKMLDRVSSVHDILVSDSYSLVQKNEALKQIIDKIVYDRESDTLKIHFFLYHS